MSSTPIYHQLKASRILNSTQSILTPTSLHYLVIEVLPEKKKIHKQVCSTFYTSLQVSLAKDNRLTIDPCSYYLHKDHNRRAKQCFWDHNDLIPSCGATCLRSSFASWCCRLSFGKVASGTLLAVLFTSSVLHTMWLRNLSVLHNMTDVSGKLYCQCNANYVVCSCWGVKQRTEHGQHHEMINTAWWLACVCMQVIHLAFWSKYQTISQVAGYSQSVTQCSPASLDREPEQHIRHSRCMPIKSKSSSDRKV